MKIYSKKRTKLDRKVWKRGQSRTKKLEEEDKVGQKSLKKRTE